MCERGTARAPGMSEMQQNTERQGGKTTIHHWLLIQQYYTVNRHFIVALSNTHH